MTDYTVAFTPKETKKAHQANPEDPGWVEVACDKITAFMTRFKQAVKAAKPKAIISVSPNSTKFAYKLAPDWLDDGARHC